MKRLILTLTGSRSDYGLMTPIYQKISRDKSLQLFMLVTGQHLLPDFRNSISQIKKDKLAKLYIGKKKSLVNTEDFLSAVIDEMHQLIEKLKPDILLLQGDRGEMLAAALVASYHNIPIIHLSGGDYSGSIDDSIRNSITKLAHIHLVTCPQSAKRLYHIGEEKNRVFIVGEPGLDLIKTMTFIKPKILAQQFHLDLSKPIVLATQHSVVTEQNQATKQIQETLEALSELNFQVIFTYPNNDPGSEAIIKEMESFKKSKNIQIVRYLGSQTYLGLMKISSVVVGNSSSGILEAPSFKVPVVNIGTRQYHRVRANNIIDVDYQRKAIKKAILYCLNNAQFRQSLAHCRNPYDQGRTSEKTLKILKQLKIEPQLLSKWLPYQGSFLKEK